MATLRERLSLVLCGLRQYFELNFQEHDVKVNIDLCEENPIALIDEIHMLNVLSNIIDNSVKYRGENASFNFSSYVSKNKVIIELSDNGIGITQEKRKHVFDKYYRSDELLVQSSKGMGLGLYYVRKIIDLHNGEIKIKSKIGVGTTVIIVLNLLKHG